MRSGIARGEVPAVLKRLGVRRRSLSLLIREWRQEVEEGGKNDVGAD